MNLFIDPRLGILYKYVNAGLFADKLTVILESKFLDTPSIGGMLHERGVENNMLSTLYTDGMQNKPNLHYIFVHIVISNTLKFQELS